MDGVLSRVLGGWGRPPAPRVEVSRPIRLSEAVANRLDWPLLPGGRHTSYPTSSSVPCGSRHVKKMIEDGRGKGSLGRFKTLVPCTCAHITTSVPPSWPFVEGREVQRCQWCLGTPWANGVDLMLASTPASIPEVDLMVCEAVRARRRNHQLQTPPQAFAAIPGSAL
jgi:hypothetical protein